MATRGRNRQEIATIATFLAGERSSQTEARTLEEEAIESDGEGSVRLQVARSWPPPFYPSSLLLGASIGHT